MKIYILAVICFLFSYSGQAQSCKRKFKDKLEKSSKLIDCGGNYTLEKLKDGSYVFKRYYAESKFITHFATYKSWRKKILHGLFEERWDDGTVVNKGMYEDNVRVGSWRINENQVGSYDNGELHGEWKVFGEDTTVVQIINYDHGKLHGEQITFDSLGQVNYRAEYLYGELINTTADTTRRYVEENPRFPGCEHLDLDELELDKCAQRKMLEYVYGNLKYPRRARRLNIQGKAMVQFVVDTEGRVVDIDVLNGVSNDIKAEVLTILRKMPTWRPGVQNGEKVKVRYTLPINFLLQD